MAAQGNERITAEDLFLLAIHYLRLPEVLQAAHGRLKPEYFTESHERPYALLWRIASEFWEKNHVLIPPAFAKAEVVKLVQELPSEYGPDFIKSANLIVDQAWQYNAAHLVSASALEILKRFLWERSISLSMVDALEKNNGIVPQHIWEELNEDVKRTTFSIGTELQPFAKGSHMLGARPRTPIGVQFIDRLLGGGLLPGEIIGWWAPSGGGKTVISHQILVEGARHKRYIVMFSYEGRLDRPDYVAEYMARVYASATGIPHDVIKAAKKPEDLAPAHREKYMKAHEEIGEYLIIVDMSQNFDGVGAIRAKLVELEARGVKPTGIIIDWFLPLAEMAYENCTSPAYKGESGARQFKRSVVKQLKDIGGEHNCWVFLTHQIAADKAMKKNLHWNDAAEVRSLPFMMDGCFTLTSFDENSKIAKLSFSKARHTSKGHCLVQLRGDINRMEQVDKDLEFDDRRGSYVLKGDANKVQDEVGESRRDAYENKPPEMSF